MTAPLRVAVAQPMTMAGDVPLNVARHAAAVRSAGARLVVFPELSLTGYDLDAAAIDPGSEVLAPLIDACASAGAVALAGAPVDVDGHDHIATLAVSASGIAVAYRKMSLGGDEMERFAAGSTPALVEVDGWHIGLGICKDTRMEAHLGATLGQGIDLYVAGLVHHDHEHHELEERAVRIARRGGVPVAFASAAGDVGPAYPSAAGGSGIWSSSGAVLVRDDGAPGGFVSSDVGDGTTFPTAARFDSGEA